MNGYTPPRVFYRVRFDGGDGIFQETTDSALGTVDFPEAAIQHRNELRSRGVNAWVVRVTEEVEQ